MVVALAKLGTPESVGQFALGLAICSPIYMFANLHLREVLATDARREFVFGDYLGLRLASTFLALVMIAVISVATGYSRDTALVIMLVGLARGFDYLSDLFYGLLQQHERMDRVAKSLLMKGPLSLAAVGLGFRLTGTVVGAAVGMAFVSALMVAAYDVRSGSWLMNTRAKASEIGTPETARLLAYLRARWEAGRMTRLAWLTLPLAVVMMLISLTTNIPRYFIERHLGQRELGIFAALAVLMMAAYVAVSALGQSASARLSNYFAQRDERSFRTLMAKLLGVALTLGLGGVAVALIAGRQFLTVLYRPEYADHTDVFLLLMIAAGISYLGAILGFGLMAARRFWGQLPLFALAAVACTMTSVTLIPSMGLLGAAIALLIAITTQTVGAALILINSVRELAAKGT